MLVQFAKDFMRADAEKQTDLGLLQMWEMNTGSELYELNELLEDEDNG